MNCGSEYMAIVEVGQGRVRQRDLEPCHRGIWIVPIHDGLNPVRHGWIDIFSAGQRDADSDPTSTTFRYTPDNVPDHLLGMIVRHILAESQAESLAVTRIRMSFAV